MNQKLIQTITKILRDTRHLSGAEDVVEENMLWWRVKPSWARSKAKEIVEQLGSGMEPEV